MGEPLLKWLIGAEASARSRCVEYVWVEDELRRCVAYLDNLDHISRT